RHSCYYGGYLFLWVLIQFISSNLKTGITTLDKQKTFQIDFIDITQTEARQQRIRVSGN
ncbi:MAG: hypothetical protein JSW63_03705, partial [Ignavibacterium sp.]